MSESRDEKTRWTLARDCGGHELTVDREYLFDVKDFTHVDIPDAGFYDAYKRLRQKIGEIRGQFREYKDWPCCAVLYNDNADLVHLTTPFIVLGAMFGTFGVRIQFDPRTGDTISETTEFLSGGKMLFRKPKSRIAEVRNTTISALITLRHVRTGYARLCHDFDEKRQSGVTAKEWIVAERDLDCGEQHIGVIVWENAFARIPFSRTVFRGDYDERYGVNDDGGLTRLYAGKGVLEYESLMGDEQSPVFTRLAKRKRAIAPEVTKP